MAKSLHCRSVRALTVTLGTELFEDVKRLGKKYSRWLGQYPVGAFEESASKGRIIAAVDDEEELLGYLLYRTSRSYVTIAHLCVASAARGTGVSHVLFDELKARTRDCHGVKLRCRRDFPASDHWPKLGFVPVSDRPGRSASGALLTTWWYGYDQPTLFAAGAEEDRRPYAVLDANILYDLQDTPDTASRGIGALSAAWLVEEVEFCVTSEIFIEINRSESSDGRARRRVFAQQYTCLPTDAVAEERVLGEIRSLFPAELSESDRSDYRQLGKAIAGRAGFFVTWDAEQLDRADVIRERYGLAILRPLDLVIGLDAKLREAEYVPSRVAGCLSTVTRISAAELENLQRAFQDFARAESRGAFIHAIHAASADLHHTETCVITDVGGQYIGLFSLDLRDPRHLRIPLLRVRRGRLADGLAHQIVWRAVTRARTTGHQIVEVHDPYLALVAEPALQSCDFVRSGATWRKHVVRVCGPRTDVIAALKERPGAADDPLLTTAISGLSEPNSAAYAGSIARLERMFWPVRITDTALSTYIVPIRPAYAAQLFDEALADQDLFGAKEHLAMSLRNVYYRSAKGIRVPSPARVLWYVSGQRGYVGSGAIRAVSLVEDSVRGPVKDLYRRFQRLGAYDWRQLIDSTAGDHQGVVEAFTFTHTELFRRSVDYHQAQDLLKRHTGNGNPFAGPVRIPEAYFADIYRLATET